MTEGFENYLGVTKRFPYAFPHPIFDYDDENERRIFFENAMTIYNNAQTMSPLHCDEQCERRLEDWKRLRVLGPEVKSFEAGENIYLECHLHFGFGNSTAGEIRWWHNSSALTSRDIQERNIRVEDEIVLDVTKESRLIFQTATFSDAGEYSCAIVENRSVKKSPPITVEVVTRKYTYVKSTCPKL